MKNLSLKIEQEIQKRALTQNDLKVQNQQLSTLRTSEKQLKQEINHLLEIKRSLEKQNMELRKYATHAYELTEYSLPYSQTHNLNLWLRTSSVFAKTLKLYIY